MQEVGILVIFIKSDECETGSRSLWEMCLVKISTCVIQVGMFYMRESKFHIFLHVQV